MIQLIGIPYDDNSSYLKGPAQAPSIIRSMETGGSANTYTEQGVDIRKDQAYIDHGDLLLDQITAQKKHDFIKSNIEKIAKEGPVCSLGGDHAIAYPLISAHTTHYQDLHVLQIDAHGDLYENFENNPFSHASPFARILEEGKIKKLTQVGIRSLTSHQREQIKRYDVDVVEMKDFDLNFIANLGSPLYISVDLDGLDPAYAPGVSHHEPGGLSTRQLLTIIHMIKSKIIGCDIVEYNPTRDINNVTAMVAYKIMKELMAKMLVVEA